MKTRLILGLFAAILLSCQGEPDKNSFVEQEQRVKNATEGLAVERQRLNELRDSLNIKIQENIALGMSKETAESVESGLIEVQETIVKASEINLTQQREVLALMKATTP